MGLLARRVMDRLGVTPIHEVGVRRKIPVPMPDGVTLLANLYEPEGLEKTPTVLVRSPYGRGVFGLSIGVPIASQGYRVLPQSCRGTSGSGGVSPMAGAISATRSGPSRPQRAPNSRPWPCRSPCPTSHR